ncbi:MAG: hypothetical protein PHG34_02335 [Candidatus Cloacimonetes bacterium]|jgi:hypothetical protein|nr:hypothetical protein [Candidatus Cloacimonadota bacterium]
MNKLKITLLAIFLFLACATLLANDIAILVDGSGSMRGFAESGSIQQVLEVFQSAISESGLSSSTTLFYCVADKKNISYEALPSLGQLSSSTFYGKYTVLDVPLIEYSTKHPAVIFITDNVDNSTGEISTDRFYHSIQNTETMRQLSVIPLIRSFSGKPYVSGQSYYNGNRGMMAYMVIYEDNYDRYKDLGDRLRKDGLELLHFFPITADHLKIGRPKEADSGYTLQSEGQKYILTKNQKMQLARSIATGKPNDIAFSFDLSSQYDHFYLKKDTKVKIVNLKIVTDSGEHIPIKASSSISPTRLLNDLNPDGVTQSFKGVITIKPEPTLWQEFKLVFLRPNIHVSFDILLEAQENGLSLTPGFESEYFTENPLTLDKIYSKNDLLSFINPYSNKIALSVQNLNDKRRPESTIAIRSTHETLIILIFLGIVALFFILGYTFIQFVSVRGIVIYEDQEEHSIVPRNSYKSQSQVFKITNKSRVRLSILDNGWQLTGHSKFESTHTILPGINYELHNQDYTRRITIRYIYT